MKIEEILDEHGQSFFDEYYDIQDMIDEGEIPLNDWEVEQVQQFGGEGEGDQFWVVFSFTKDGETKYVKFYGWYESYNGTEYEGYKFVTPQEKVITVYE